MVYEAYDWCAARTNIDIDDELLAIVLRRHGTHIKTEAVDLALRHLAGRPLTVDEALDLRGAHLTEEIPDDVGP